LVFGEIAGARAPRDFPSPLCPPELQDGPAPISGNLLLERPWTKKTQTD
jgi:hypothetical protein